MKFGICALNEQIVVFFGNMYGTARQLADDVTEQFCLYDNLACFRFFDVHFFLNGQIQIGCRHCQHTVRADLQQNTLENRNRGSGSDCF